MVLLHYELQQLPANGLNAMKLLPDTDTEMCPPTRRRQNQYCSIIIKATHAYNKGFVPFQIIIAFADKELYQGSSSLLCNPAMEQGKEGGERCLKSCPINLYTIDAQISPLNKDSMLQLSL
jgi:hypothetical protein